MTESRVHVGLVKLVCQCVRDEYLGGDTGAIFCDAAGLFACDKERDDYRETCSRQEVEGAIIDLSYDCEGISQKEDSCP